MESAEEAIDEFIRELDAAMAQLEPEERDGFLEAVRTKWAEHLEELELLGFEEKSDANG